MRDEGGTMVGELAVEALVVDGMEVDRVEEHIKNLKGKNEDEAMNKDEAIDLMELFSEPRVMKHCDEYQLKAGEAVDLKTGWDLNRWEDREAVLEYVKFKKPEVVIGSPPCTMFSSLQNLSPWTAEKQKRWRKDLVLLRFAAKIYKLQTEAGRYYVHEHPATASSWRESAMKDLIKQPGARTVISYLCMFGLTTEGSRPGVQMAARKRTKFMTNFPEVAQVLERRCDGSHQHQPLLQGRAKRAEEYTDELCKAICRGIKEQFKMDQAKVKFLMSVNVKDKVGDIPEEEHVHEDAKWAWDDITGKALDPKEVQRARLQEMGYINDKGVWKVVDRRWTLAREIPIVGTRWLDVDKGDARAPNLRSRLVAQEYNDGQEYTGLFAATPPLEALRLLVSEAATVRSRQPQEDNYILIADVSRAFFEAPAVRTVCVELPDEAFEDGRKVPGKVGLLQLSLYGTRDAAANFQKEVGTFMKDQSFEQSQYNPCTYRRRDRRVAVLVHGDDFVATGSRKDVLNFNKSALEKRFEIKSILVGPPRN